MDADVSTHTFLTMIIEKSVCVWTIFFVCAIILMWYTRNIFLLASDIFFINWTVLMSDNLPQRVQILGHAHIISCQIFGDLLLKSAFERIFNVMQLILVKIKWKYLIQKFHDICLSYYVNTWNSKTRQMSNIHCVHQITIPIILLCSTNYCVQQLTVSSKILCLHLLLSCTCSTFPCRHAAVVSCLNLRSSLFGNFFLKQW